MTARDKNADPWLSVLLPVFNGAKTLETTLSSVATQSDGIELIAVDQGSIDESLAILNRYASKIRITIIDARNNKNWVQNTNLALSKAKAGHATLLHQDDIWFSGRTSLLETMLRSAPEASLWLHSANYINTEGKIIGRFRPPFGKRPRTIKSEDALGHLLVQNTVALPAAMFPTDRAIEVGGLDETLWYTSDWDFWLKLAGSGPIAWSPTDAAGFRIHGSAQTVTGSRNVADFEDQLSIPVRRHLNKLPESRRDSVEKLALASNALNVVLAAAYHGKKGSRRALFQQILGLGPRLWWPFVRDTRIMQRVLPRLLHLRRSGGDAST